MGVRGELENGKESGRECKSERRGRKKNGETEASKKRTAREIAND